LEPKSKLGGSICAEVVASPWNSATTGVLLSVDRSLWISVWNGAWVQNIGEIPSLVKRKIENGG